jgi:hypothetical protein
MPFGPIEVILAGTPGEEFECPPKLVEVTDAGTPLICAFAAGGTRASQIHPPAIRTSAATVAEFSRFTYESYPSLETMKQTPSQIPLNLIRASTGAVGLSIFGQFEEVQVIEL